MWLCVAELYPLQKNVFCLMETVVQCHVSRMVLSAYSLLLTIHQIPDIFPMILIPLVVNPASDVRYFFLKTLLCLDVFSQVRDILDCLWQVYLLCSVMIFLFFHEYCITFSWHQYQMAMGHSYSHIIQVKACCLCSDVIVKCNTDFKLSYRTE